MPQHPQYSNSPAKDLKRLYNLIKEMEHFGIVHEEVHQYINAVMSDLYPDAMKKCVIDEEGEFDEEEYSLPYADSLFEYVDKSEQPQYIQDLRNTIACHLSSSNLSSQGVADEIRDRRDISYYWTHVSIDEDTQTLSQYRFVERTVWFPRDVKPVREGAYEISFSSDEPKHAGFAYWDGTDWYQDERLLTACLDLPKTAERKAYLDYCWRGFTEEQSNS